MTHKKCQLCSRLSSGLRKLLNILFGKRLDCHKINSDTHNSSDKRVSLINEHAPDCRCEAFSMSEFSPSPIADTELISRFVFSPIHTDKKTGKFKPSLFSHIFDKGCSIQRETKATNNEMSSFVSDFLSKDARFSWQAVVMAKCNNLRDILIDDKIRIICLYDTATKANPAHGEVCVSREISDADRLELRSLIFDAFNKTELPNDYRNGKINKSISN